MPTTTVVPAADARGASSAMHPKLATATHGAEGNWQVEFSMTVTVPVTWLDV